MPGRALYASLSKQVNAPPLDQKLQLVNMATSHVSPSDSTM